jgi:sortase A
MNKVMPKVLMIMGALSLVVAGALFVYSRVDDYLAGQRADRLLAQVLDEGLSTLELTEPDALFSNRTLDAEALENNEERTLQGTEEQDPGAAGAPIRFEVIGILEIPKFNRKYPVLDRSISVLLNISVCRYSGKVEDKPIRLVIAGHNLRSHFGRIATLEAGDEITFTTIDGEKFRYKMIYIESCHMDNPGAVQEGDEWDITLMTCQKDRSMRDLVRFKEIKQED